MTFIIQQLLLYLSIIVLLFLPGYFLLSAIFKKNKSITAFEKFILSFGFSLVIIDFIMILLGKLNISLNRWSILISIGIFIGACALIKKFITGREKEEKSSSFTFNFSKNQTILIILILILTVFIKTVYLKDSIFPTATDLGHHMYWTKTITETGKLPVYAENNIVTVDGNYKLSPPQNIADFIIGEHLPFAAISLMSGADVISSFPVLILFLIDILSLLAVFILALRLFEDYSFGKNAALLALLLIGPIYAISSPQEKFVSGGVIGNIIGNFLLPLVIYFFYRALKEKSSVFMALAVLTTFGLAYTHHLTTFIFIFAFLFALILFVIFNFKNLGENLKEWRKIILSPKVLIVLISAFLFFALVYAPSYAQKSAIDTAVGTPTKVTRTGLTFTQLSFTGGEARMALGLFGLIILLALKSRKNYSSLFLAGWLLALLVMSLQPQYLFVDIPSDRIGNYITYPLAIISAFALAWLFGKIKEREISQKIGYAFFAISSAFIVWGGFYDNSQFANEKINASEAVQTFAASDYLAQKINASDMVLKDHIYITADSWIKVFLMKGYNYPLSRAYLKRYEDSGNPREMCTLWMISTPVLNV